MSATHSPINRRADIPRTLQIDSPAKTVVVQPTYTTDFVTVTGTATTGTYAAVRIGQAYDGYEASVYNATAANINVQVVKKDKTLSTTYSVVPNSLTKLIFNKVVGWLLTPTSPNPTKVG